MPIPAQRDLEATRSTLTDWLAGKLPDARDLTLGPLVAPAGTGFSNDTLLFDATWTEGGETRGEEYVARIRPSGYQVFPETDVALQYRVMKILGEGTDVPVPTVFWLEEDGSVLGQPFFLMRRVHGEIPSDSPPFTMEGFLVDATPSNRKRLWNSGIDAMRIAQMMIEFEVLPPRHRPRDEQHRHPTPRPPTRPPLPGRSHHPVIGAPTPRWRDRPRHGARNRTNAGSGTR
jgi:hypothetical protein